MAMSVFGLWASSTVLVIFYALKDSLPLCPNASYWTPFGYIHLDCGAVLSSKYSTFYGVPLEVFALFYFAVNIGLVYVIGFGPERAYRICLNILFGWRFIGIIIVPYLVFIEFFVLHAICLYCSIMHIAIVTDFIIISYLLFFKEDSLEEQGAAGEVLPTQPSTGPA